ncbi:unnamed protein product [Caenorhabditis auriculariae]|uniref:Uncharacterized protein n=1 Tax=Caenorhabditis auriculariae TaxID=2777116 RepID=A0A8S1H3V1_9PELO|nr:unnamed protein product [Caenorhabditis auriculariae]
MSFITQFAGSDRKRDRPQESPDQIKSLSIADVQKMIDNFTNAFLKVSDQNEKLEQMVITLTATVEDLKSTILKLSQTPPPASPKPSYADVLRYDILVATKEAQSAPLRESSFVIHNLVNEKKDEIIVEEICQLSSVEKAQEIFRLGKSTTPPPPLRVHLQNKDAVVKVLKNFNELKGKIPSLRTASVQRDMSKTELEKHRAAWKEAVRRNDAAASRIWTVRDFEVVKLRLPAGVERHPWSVRSQEPKAKL